MRFGRAFRVAVGLAIMLAGTMHLSGGLWVAAVLAIFGGAAVLLDCIELNAHSTVSPPFRPDWRMRQIS